MPIVCLLLMLMTPLAALAAPVEVQQAGWQVAAGEGGLPDLQGDDWQALAADEQLNLGIVEHPVWLKYTVSRGNTPAVLVIPYALLNTVDFYWVKDGRVISEHHTGDLRAFDSRPVPHRYFVFPVPDDHATVTALIRVQTTGALQVPVEVHSAEAFLDKDQWVFAWLLVFTGIMVALALYNTFLFLLVRQCAYFWYVISVVATALVQINFHGLNFQFLWRGFPALNEVAMVILIALNIVGSVVFTDVFLRVYEHSRFASRLLRTLAALAGLMIIAGVFMPYHTGVLVVMLLTYIATFSAWVIGLVLWRRGEVLARFYVFAWTPLLLGHVVISSSKAGILPSHPVFDYAPQVGATLEVILLSFALAYRINIERRRRLQAQDEVLHAQREANQMLEERVHERTRELASANAQLKAMSFTDGLTGIANRRHFDDRLAEEWRASSRHQHPLGLLLMDIDHFKDVNDTYGHQAGDDCLKALADLVMGQIHRSTDMVARYGGEEFALLLPATDHDGARAVAERIRKTLAEKDLKVTGQSEPIRISVSIGVVAEQATGNAGAEDMLARADKALYAAKNSGRNRVVVAV